MKVEFSPSQRLTPRASSLVNGGVPPPALTSPLLLEGMTQLQSKLNDLTVTRPDQMDATRPLVSNVNYPSEQVFNAISQLLALHLAK